MLNRSVRIQFTESIPWIQFTLSFDEQTLDKEILLCQLKEQLLLVEEIIK